MTQNRLDVLLRCISATFFLSDSFRRDTNLFVADQNDSHLYLFKGSLIKGLNPDERALAGWLRKNLRSQNQRGLTVLASSMDEFLTNFDNIFILTKEGNLIDEVSVLPSGALFAIGSHRGYSQQDKECLKAHGGQPLSLGTPEYLSSTTLSLIHWQLDRHLLDNSDNL
ncbi:MAG: hypothetical protein ACE5OZ_04425 [Candidatus Heimdallarchaeota archaeon]